MPVNAILLLSGASWPRNTRRARKIYLTLQCIPNIDSVKLCADNLSQLWGLCIESRIVELNNLGTSYRSRYINKHMSHRSDIGALRDNNGTVLHSSDESGELSKWLESWRQHHKHCQGVIIIIIIIIINGNNVFDDCDKAEMLNRYMLPLLSFSRPPHRCTSAWILPEIWLTLY